MGLTAAIAIAAAALSAPLGKVYDDAPVVTNVTFEGLAATSYVDAKVAAATNGLLRADALAAKQDRPAATAAAASLALRPDGAAVSVAVAAGGELAADLSGWTDGQAQTALISLAPGATVADGVRLAGYGSWPTNRFLASCIRVGSRIYVTPITYVAAEEE